MNRGNVDRVMADAKKIARQWSELGVPLETLQRKYRCSYYTIVRAIRTVISKEQWQRIRYRHEVKGGRKTRFKKGCIGWNKGRHFYAGSRSVETQFKKGHLRGQAARRWRPVGTITIRNDKLPEKLRHRKRKAGMPAWPRRRRRWIKIKDTGPPQYCWIPYARWLWQKKFGPVPAGYFVAHKDGNTLNDNEENFVLVNHAEALTLQLQRDPGQRIRMRRSAGRAATKRHAINRMVKSHFTFFWQCHSCGADVRTKKRPSRCIKCGGGAFEKIKLLKQTG